LVGEVDDASMVTLKLSEGIHRIQLRVAWCRSRRRKVDIQPLATTHLVCHSRANRLNAVLMVTLGCRGYISLSN
jgi:hypothetical protein